MSGKEQTTDFRLDPMESSDGRGFARKSWDAYVRGTNKLLGPALNPLIEPQAKKVAGSMVVDLMGFWMVWQLEGGYEGLRRTGMSRSAIYRRVKLFRTLFKMHPDEFVLPGVEFDLAAYRSGQPTKRERAQVDELTRTPSWPKRESRIVDSEPESV